ncbi:ETC complex I subunit [Tepidicaulis sp. LMO-SS28]|uniref:ETC complex I subunit n=1 Tax=Tepidicaulis sp. LMO-SS28 TaxID=3447455 RepID=UPI003EE3C3E1
MRARIYQPARTAMQSGTAKTRKWVLEFDPQEPKRIDPLMGYTSSGDMLSQVRLTFDTREEAVDYAEKHEIPYDIYAPKPRRPKLKAYADNFKFGRIGQWTH